MMKSKEVITCEECKGTGRRAGYYDCEECDGRGTKERWKDEGMACGLPYADPIDEL